jgi:hypothetical protein
MCLTKFSINNRIVVMAVADSTCSTVHTTAIIGAKWLLYELGQCRHVQIVCVAHSLWDDCRHTLLCLDCVYGHTVIILAQRRT